MSAAAHTSLPLGVDAGERLKCVLQIQESPTYKGVKYSGYKDLVKGLYAEGGLMGVCRGSGITSPPPLGPASSVLPSLVPGGGVRCSQQV